MKKLLICTMIMAFCLMMAVPAMAANVFVFTEKSVTLFEGESVQAVLRREGVYEGDGEITFTSLKPSTASVSEDGTITAVNKGQTEVTAALKRDGKRVGNPARIGVKVLRAVNKVTLNTTKLSVYDPDDPTVTELLWEPPMNQVLVMPAGTTATLSTTCTPEDASNRQVTYTSTDAGVAKISGNILKAVQRGECELTVACVQNPDVTETFHVLVIQPVKKIQIDAGNKKVAAGSTLQLTAICSPENASIKDVVWSSKNTGIATVDEKGVVTGLKKGTVNITATAADGSRIAAAVTLTVTQSVESISFSQNQISLIAGRTTQAKVTVLPATANDRTVKWSSSDETIATVKNGQITGKKAGVCTIYCTSNSNPEVSAGATVTVSQLVTKIENLNAQSELNILVGENVQTRWNVLPDDATNKGLTFRSQQPKIATVDAHGLVSALRKGTATIVATAADGSKKQGTVRVNVIQPVTGVRIPSRLVYVQRGGGATVRAEVLPRNANNQRVSWSSDNEGIVTVRTNGTSTGALYGVTPGYATITTYTEDGGFTATTTVRVGNFNEAVRIEDLDVNANNEIKITLRNASQDITLYKIRFKIECFDLDGNPMICNVDGASTSFEGDYSYMLLPNERTSPGAFRFLNHVIDQPLGSVVLTILSWQDENGNGWTMQNNQNSMRWYRYNYNPPVGTEYNNPGNGMDYINQGEGVG